MMDRALRSLGAASPTVIKLSILLKQTKFISNSSSSFKNHWNRHLNLPKVEQERFVLKLMFSFA